MKVPSRHRALSFAAALCAAGVLSLAVAQSPRPITDMQRPQLPMAIVDMQSRAHERAARIDANRDGYVAPEEIQAHRAARQAQRVQQRMARFDTNHDGRVSTIEFEIAQTARIGRADANGDGQITRGEIRALRLHRRAERLQRRGQSRRDPNA